MQLSKEEREKLKDEVKKDILKDLEDKVSKEVKKHLEGKSNEKHIKEITAKVLEDLFRALWNRSSMWKGSVIK
jgi:FKBP-type peptidyl-prolyl cis-trans isomerase (trigger factor)